MDFLTYLAKNQFIPALSVEPKQAPSLIIVIPCYKEPQLLRTLQSLYRCQRSVEYTEVIVVINHPDNAPDEAKRLNEKTWSDAQNWIASHTDKKLQFHIIYKPDIPQKDAGVGFARKMGMDEAVYRFGLFGVSNGVIAGFDADAECDSNYLIEIERAFANPKVNGASIYFEHPTEGKEYAKSVYIGISLYELHLRYLNQALRYAGFPYAFHTVGSSFAVRVSAYLKQGGMNKRKAGEDFHFLQKIIPLGNYIEINTTRVIPSPRPSDRVPFGTGASIGRWLENEDKTTLFTYAPDLFDHLKSFFSLVPKFHQANRIKIIELCQNLPDTLLSYLQQNNYETHIELANANSSSLETFSKRFYNWFNGLQTVKYLNTGSMCFPKIPVHQAANQLLEISGFPKQSDFDLLSFYRKWERG